MSGDSVMICDTRIKSNMKKCNEVEEQRAEARLKVLEATEVSDCDKAILFIKIIE